MPKKILSIEDDPFINEMYTRALRKAGYEVDESADGVDSLKKLREKEYDLILLDLFIPEKTGFEVLEEIRKDKKISDKTKIVIITNFMQDDESRIRLEKSVDGYLIKANVVPSKLVELVNELLGQ